MELLTVFAADAYWGSGFTAHYAEEDCALRIEMFSSFMLQGHPESYSSRICRINGISVTRNFTVASLDFYLSLAYKLFKKTLKPVISTSRRIAAKKGLLSEGPCEKEDGVSSMPSGRKP